MEVFKWELKSLNVSLFYLAFRWKIGIIALKVDSFHPCDDQFVQ